MSAISKIEESVKTLTESISYLEDAVRLQKKNSQQRNEKISQLSLALDSEREMREQINFALDNTINRVESLLDWKDKNK